MPLSRRGEENNNSSIEKFVIFQKNVCLIIITTEHQFVGNKVDQ